MTLKRVLCALVTLLLGADQICVAAPAVITSDDIAVFRAVLSPGCRRADRSYSVVSDLPLPAQSQSTPPERPPLKLWMKLAARISSGVKWPHVNICAAYRIVDGKKIDSIFAGQTRVPPGWEPFYASFRGAKGLIRISLPAFTSDRKRAVVYLEWTCKPSCGSGFYLELKREKEGWKQSRLDSAWIS